VPAERLTNYLEIAAASALERYSMMSPACRSRDPPFGVMFPALRRDRISPIGSEQRTTGHVSAVSAP
jgi:hypothetical protein